MGTGEQEITTEDVFIGLGSNLGDSDRELLRGWERLGHHPEVALRELSPPFLSAPVDMSSNHWFTNAVGRLATTLSVHQLLKLLLATEEQLGRQREDQQRGYQDRLIDLDLLFFGSLIVDEPRLTIPHPRLAERLFVLEPMRLIAPEFVDPLSGRTIEELHQRFCRRLASGELASQEISRGRWPEQP